MTAERELQLKILACKVRIGIVESTYSAKAGHPGGSLSSADALTYLYFELMNIDPKDPAKEDRDRLVLSKGHAAPALYAALANRGFFPVEDLRTLRHIDSYLQGHPNMNMVPGIDMSTGSLGQGVSAACGMALGARYKGLDKVRVYTVMGDGEMEEGEVWEAAMFAAHYKLDNLCLIIDWNGLQIDGPVSEVMDPGPIDRKLEVFGFHVQTIDGHDFNQLELAFKNAAQVTGRPQAIIMKTVKGRGVSYMENQVDWHGKAPNDEEYKIAMDELNAQLAELEAQV